MKTNLWIFETHRPHYTIVDSLRNARVKRLYEAAENDTIEDQPEARKHQRNYLSYASLDHSEKELKEMIVAHADEDGRIVTEDPVTAFLVNEDLSKLPLINHPMSRKPVQFEMDKLSAAVPKSLAEAEKMLKKG